MTVLKYIQLPYFFDVARMQQEVAGVSGSHWKLHYQQLHYEGEWSAIPLRSVDASTDNIMIAPQEGAVYKNTVFLDACPYIKTVLEQLHCPLLAVRLLKLNSGAIIKEHKDHELYYEKGEIRLHIPVVTHEAVEFYLDKERVQPKEGECWYMNFNLPHSIINKSPVDRIHLVIDAVVNDWVKEQFAQPGLLKKEIEEPGYDAATKKAIIAQLRSMNTETGNRLADEMEASLQ
jgi:hypothetical protein